MDLLQVNIFELMLLWGELVAAYYGVNGFGGDVAEIYAYRFQAYNPTIHCQGQGSQWFATDIYLSERKDFDILTGRQLVELLKLFCKSYNCAAKVNNLAVDDFLYRSNVGDIIFNYRVHVEIVHNNANEAVLEPASLDLGLFRAQDAFSRRYASKKEEEDLS